MLKHNLRDFPGMEASPMSVRKSFLIGLGGLLGTAAVRAWMGTLDYKVAYYDPAVDPALPECQGQKIYLFWHEYILFPFSQRGHCNLAMLLSRHRDAEVLSRAARHMGFEIVRGSTRRGGVAAIRELLRKSRHMHLAITPDGPLGPRRRMAPGPVYLASKLGMPLTLLGFGYDRPWRVTTWDRFAVPRPGSRARCVPSPPIHVPPNLDREGLEHFRERLERVLNRLTLEAEGWAESGVRKIGQRPVHPGPARLSAGRLHPAQAVCHPHWESGRVPLPACKQYGTASGEAAARG
jgi:lysophospholipid acyltransferase (LPLAT)-like uncharacterized protein